MMRLNTRPAGQRRRAPLAAELARLRHIERVARDFCARCERGEIRSVATYELFRAAIARPGGDAARAVGAVAGDRCVRGDG